MTPETAIDQLDRQIAAHGEEITLRRVLPNAAALEASMRGVVRGYRPEQITDGITLGASQVILSPTALMGTPFEAEENWPRKNDRIIIDGRVRNIEAPNPIKINDVLVRFNLQVAG